MKQQNDITSVLQRGGNKGPPKINSNRGFYTAVGLFWALGENDEYPYEKDLVDAEIRQSVEAGLPIRAKANRRRTEGNTRRLVDRNTPSGRMTAFFRGNVRGPKIDDPTGWQRQKDSIIREGLRSRPFVQLTNRANNGK